MTEESASTSASSKAPAHDHQHEPANETPNPQPPILQNEQFKFLILTHKDTDILTMSSARQMLPLDFPAIETADLCSFTSDTDMSTLLTQKAHPCSQVVIVVRLLGRGVPGFQHLLDYARKHDQDLIVVSGIPNSYEPDLTAMCTVSAETIHEVMKYFNADGCARNMAHMLRFLADHLMRCGFGYNAPTPQPDHGLYHPRFTGADRDVETIGHLERCHNEKKKMGKAMVGIIFYRCHFLSGNTAFVDAFIDELEAINVNAIGLFTESLRDDEPHDNINGQAVSRFPTALTHLVESTTGQCQVDVLVSTMAFALGEVNPDGPTLGNWCTEAVQALNVPVLQAITSVDTRQAWEESARGLNPLDTAMNVAIPEFDGRIITVPISFKAPSDETNNVHYYEPLLDRVAAVAKQAGKLGRLRHKPNKEKKVAFLLTNSSGKAQRIGDAVGLDTPASIMHLFEAMQAADYHLGDDELPPDGDKLIQDLIDRCSYDEIYLTEQQLANAAAHVPADVYQGMFDRLPIKQKKHMEEQWGSAPGVAYVHEDSIALSGLEFGNVFVALQPPRGYGMDPDKIYHTPDLPPPHNYFALYKWLRDEWQADAIVHMGKHGTLEWLPGKGVGLSSDCFPDSFLDDMPLIYPFIINDPGEGTQSKRRAHAIIIDHMCPPITTADGYGGLAVLMQLVDEYYQVEMLDPSKLPFIQKQIWDVIQEVNLGEDLALLLNHDHDHDHDEHNHDHGDDKEHHAHKHDDHGSEHEHDHQTHDDHDNEHSHEHGHHAHKHDHQTHEQVDHSHDHDDHTHKHEHHNHDDHNDHHKQKHDHHAHGDHSSEHTHKHGHNDNEHGHNDNEHDHNNEHAHKHGHQTHAPDDHNHDHSSENTHKHDHHDHDNHHNHGDHSIEHAHQTHEPDDHNHDHHNHDDHSNEHAHKHEHDHQTHEPDDHDHDHHAHEKHEIDLNKDGTPSVIAKMDGKDFAHLIEDMDGYLCELAGAQIRDGLHILGQIPAGDHMVDTLHALTRLPNLDVPSLREAVAGVFGLDLPMLLENQGKRLSDVPPMLVRLADRPLATSGDAVETIDELAKHLLALLAQQHFDSKTVPHAIGQTLVGFEEGNSAETSEIKEVLDFVCESLVPSLNGTTQEITHLLTALNGEFVPAGPSGSPSRGMAHILPTGRNFYAVDPNALPSMAAWDVGQGLAKEVSARYLTETGVYPEHVAISVWGTAAMRTHGDDIAQIFALLGIKPIWQRENHRVTGVELIPLEELGRPRIDVTVRISGFFRDAFPHLISLLDDAVNLAINADEPIEQNYIRKHFLEDMENKGEDEAMEEHSARYRIFGCPPGAYGIGILDLIEAQNWEDESDFAKCYINWGGYAYSKSEPHGVDARSQFTHRLTTVKVAIHNQDDREHDIFDSDDYFQFHGGMIATIHALSGKRPKGYFGDTQNPAAPKVRDIKEETMRVYRTRVVNPKWLDSISRHGYKGASEMAATVDYLFGFDATADVVSDFMYEQVAQSYALDKATQEFFEESNPWALAGISERLLEAAQRGMWAEPSAETLEGLRQTLLKTDEMLEGRGEQPS